MLFRSTFNHYFHDITKTPDAVILGCTHFPLIAKELQHYFGDKTSLIHSGEAMVEHLSDLFDFSKKYLNPHLKFFASENPEALREVARKWLSLPSI